MRMPRAVRWMTLAGLMGGAACDDVGPTAPVADELSAEDRIALQALVDPQAVDASVELAQGGASASPWHGMGGHGQQGTSPLAEQARAHFDLAREALGRGDSVGAAQRSREARRLVARNVHERGGTDAILAMVERMEDLALTAALEPGGVHDGLELSRQMGLLAGWARDSMGRGDLIRAGALGVLGEQRVNQCNGDGLGIQGGGTGGQRGGLGGGHGQGGHGGQGGGTPRDAEGVELVVELGATAVDLAGRLLEEWGADEEQLSYLAAAEEAQAAAEEALASELLQRAAYLAGLAQWQSLKALVLPGGITDEEAQAMLELATSLYDQAVVTVGGEPTEQEADLLYRAGHMIELGQSLLEGGNTRGVSPLWRATVIAAWLLG